MVNELKIRQTNLNNGTVETGKFNTRVEVFFGIRAYLNHNTQEVISKLQNGETSFTVLAGIENNVEILYEVI